MSVESVLKQFRMELKRVIVVHYGEIGLKGQNRAEFVNQLRDNIRKAFAQRGLTGTVKTLPGLLKILLPEREDQQDTNLTSYVEVLKKVFGIVWFAPAFELKHSGFVDASEFESLHTALVSVILPLPIPEGGFAVRVRRGDKRLPFQSSEMERELGAVILRNTQWKRVNLTNPQVTLEVDFREREVFIYTERIEGPGGLPVGITGHVIGLLSGGIDSPVAIWLMGKRGCTVDLVHFAIEEETPESIRASKVYTLACKLAEWLGHVRLYVAPYTYFDLALLRSTTPYGLVLFRRFMLRVAERIAAQTAAQAIVTGDSLAQVASQTLPNLVTTTLAVQIPVFRPLLGFDKSEIIALAQKIGTYEISIQPYKDCCALVDRHPKTRSDHGKISKLEVEQFPDYEQLIEQTLKSTKVLEIPGGGASQLTSEVETQTSA